MSSLCLFFRIVFLFRLFSFSFPAAGEFVEFFCGLLADSLLFLMVPDIFYSAEFGCGFVLIMISCYFPLDFESFYFFYLFMDLFLKKEIGNKQNCLPLCVLFAYDFLSLVSLLLFAFVVVIVASYLIDLLLVCSNEFIFYLLFVPEERGKNLFLFPILPAVDVPLVLVNSLLSCCVVFCFVSSSSLSSIYTYHAWIGISFFIFNVFFLFWQVHCTALTHSSFMLLFSLSSVLIFYPIQKLFIFITTTTTTIHKDSSRKINKQFSNLIS